MSAFEEKLNLQAREREASIRAGDSLPLVPYAPDDGGFLAPEAAARQMGIPTAELLRLAEMGVLAHRGPGYGLRVRPAILSGAISARSSGRERRPVSASRDRELSTRDATRELAERPHVSFVDDDG